MRAIRSGQERVAEHARGLRTEIARILLEGSRAVLHIGDPGGHGDRNVARLTVSAPVEWSGFTGRVMSDAQIDELEWITHWSVHSHGRVGDCLITGPVPWPRSGVGVPVRRGERFPLVVDLAEQVLRRRPMPDRPDHSRWWDDPETRVFVTATTVGLVGATVVLGFVFA